ncbi:hypothetical protein TRAPUB_6905 [Trametes pubescens]|uniref:Uncharacterized protein n=1 Tax=Trametes pubescens TaxID=154538 RepID=A0A1M2V4T2_TRAPU|nr:hypothetical protein TRAPUB_6905 [Trametes pubescens]
MLLFGRSDGGGSKKPIPLLADLQSREDQRDLDHSTKDLTAAEKAHDKSVKAAFNAHRAVDKAIENEYETAKALNRATHNHEVAISNEQNARITAEINQQYEVHLQQGLEQKGRHLDELHQRKAQHDQLRESTSPQPHVPTTATVASDEPSDQTAAATAVAPNEGHASPNDNNKPTRVSDTANAAWENAARTIAANGMEV